MEDAWLEICRFSCYSVSMIMKDVQGVASLCMYAWLCVEVLGVVSRCIFYVFQCFLMC